MKGKDWRDLYMESMDSTTVEILTANEVTKLLKCSVKTIYKLNSLLQLPARYKIFDGSKGFRWSQEDVEAYIEKKKIFLPPARESRRTPPCFIPVESLYKRHK